MFETCERVYIGGNAACRDGTDGLAVVHACKSPCHQRAVGFHSAEGFAVAVDLMGMYALEMLDKLDGFRPQIRKAAANATRWNTPQRHTLAEYHFEKIIDVAA